ncbi:MAG TPA: hypothetical protein VGO47_03005, partial [Chlamydiales bacterium]|nr:hypothetical protein [Chlamydiales bacterium]
SILCQFFANWVLSISNLCPTRNVILSFDYMIDEPKGFVDFFFTGGGDGRIFVIFSWDLINSMSKEMSM